MAAYQSEIHCNLRGAYDSKLSHRIYFIQQYAPRHAPENISDKQTYWSRCSYSTKNALLAGIKEQSLIDGVKKELAREAAEMFYKGFVVAGFVICVGESDKCYAVDNFDLEHLKMVCAMPEYSLGTESANESQEPGR
jgi:hypothetical protein